MEEQCIRFIKPANIYRYCCSWGSWPITKERAAQFISSWVMDHNWNIDIVENDLVRCIAPEEKKD